MKKLLTTSALSLILVISAQAAVVAHYSFDTDYSLTSGSYAGTLSEVENGTSTVAAGSATNVFGDGAAAFSSDGSGSAYLDMSTALNFAANDPWSVSFWVNFIGADVRAGMILGDRTDTTNFIWRTNNTSQVPDGGIRYRSDTSANAEFSVNPALQTNVWEHWVIIHDGAGSMTAYQDNNAKPAEATTGLFQNINTIGHAYTSSALSLNGFLDELYIFDEAIDPATVNSLFTSNAVPEPSTLALIGLIGMGLFMRRRR